ncbi:phosphotransferase enzyme family protein [Desulfovibrio psychrotolerans]|uniref:Aminoglycoside phosphotransferase n=1 Tax=Desulfovibrio psychrotolerans TaxID=415242 RepID=A0A7J0BRA6_9BACT|nr:phosphotransferase [Desulfovibrio psychrotolerans]GFM35751.1 aminoglycoside phosphotransferase [Desulfovibrio psychrotolerans]
MRDILSRFDLTLHRVRDDIFIPGSPERCIARCVAEDTRQRLWLVERLPLSRRQRRETVGWLVSTLAAAGAQGVHGFRRAGPSAVSAAYETPDRTPGRISELTSETGAYTVLQDGCAWQCSPFIPGVELPRPEYLGHAWRGTHIADCIAGIGQAWKRMADGGARCPENAEVPPLPAYIDHMQDTLRLREPGVHARTEPVVRSLAPLFEAWSTLPRTLAHGDCHPLNIIWGADSILGLIDWEFCGMQPVLYDAANCIGCVGFEHPDGLVNGMVPAMIAGLRGADMLTAETLPWLPPFVLALRFAWLSEWLRKRDHEMVEMELDYMEILLRHQKDILTRWRQC